MASGGLEGFIDRIEAERRKTASDSPKGERSELIDGISNWGHLGVIIWCETVLLIRVLALEILCG
jgi:hypothetical protein